MLFANVIWWCVLLPQSVRLRTILIAVGVVYGLMMLGTRHAALVPGRQSAVINRGLTIKITRLFQM